MNEKSPVPAILEEPLRRYLAIQSEERRLREEKMALQERIAGHMAALSLKHWFPDLDGISLKIRALETTDVKYNDDLLRTRLGERYTSILAPDLTKIKRELPRLDAALAPHLQMIGSPTPDKVKAAIAAGIIKKDEFAGAFTKTIRRVFAVSRVRPDQPTDPDAAPVPSGG